MKHKTMKKSVSCLLIAAMCMSLCINMDTKARDINEDDWQQEEETPQAGLPEQDAGVYSSAKGTRQSASGISDPKREPDTSMTAGQKVTWDCVWFGSYPQAEVVPSVEDYTVYDQDLLRDDDFIVNVSLYNNLQSAIWDDNNEIIIDGNKYRRMKKSDAAYANTNASGHYKWSGDIYHYFKYEPIKWLVLKAKENQLFLLSDIVLDSQKYNTKDQNVTWKTSTIRSWLNGYGMSVNEEGIDYRNKNFLNSAFSSDEEASIDTTSVINADNIKYNTDGGDDTNDKIFLLSELEIYGTDALLHGFASSNGNNDEARRSKDSAFAWAMGDNRYSGVGDSKSNASWWLRSPGYSSDDAIYVLPYGYIYVTGSDIYNVRGVRPALNLNLSSSCWKPAGTVCSDGTKNEISFDADPTDPVDPDPTNPDANGSITEFTLDAECTGSIDDSLTLRGTLKPSKEAKVTKDFWLSEIADIKWTSSNPEIIDPDFISCSPSIYGMNYSYAELRVAVFPKAKGTAVITGKTAGGLTAQCKITAEESEETKKEKEFDESLYRAKVLYDFYKDNHSGMNYDFSSDTPSKIIYSAAKENGLAASAVMWDSMKESFDLAGSPSGILDVDEAFTQKSMYEGIIFAIFQEASDELSFTEEEVHKNAKDLLGVIKTDMYVHYGIKIADDLAGATSEEKELVFQVMDDCLKKNKKFIKAVNGLQGALKCADVFDTIQEYAEHCANCIAISSMSESHKQVLRDMLAACPTDNPDLKNALKECAKLMDEQMEKFTLKITGGSILLAGKEAAKWGIDKMWSDITFAAWSQCPGAAAFWAAYKTGTFAADSIFHTSDTAEKTLKMSAMLEVRELLKKIHEKEKAAFAGEKNTGNAQAYLSSVDVFYHYLDEDCGTALSFTDTVTGSLAGKLQAHFGSSSGEELKKSIQNIQNSYRLGYGQTQTLWLYELENDYPNLYKKYQDISQKLHEKFFVHCPVDIYIKDSNGEVVAAVVDNVPYCKEGEPFTVASVGDEKEIWVYGDKPYTVSYVGTAAGKMDITVNSYNCTDYDGHIDTDLVRTVKYGSIPLKKGTEYTSKMNLPSSKDEYQLKDEDGQEIGWSADTAETYRKNYTLKLDNALLISENGAGIEGKFYPGEKITVYASIPKDAVFREWEWKADTEKIWILNSDETKITFMMPNRDMKISALYDRQETGDDGRKDPPVDEKRDVKISSITLSGISSKIAAGKKVKLTAAVSPANAANKAVTWTSSNKKVATVNSKGIVTLKKKTGGKSVTITAAAQDGSNIKATYRITSMKGIVKKVTVSGKKTVKVGKTLKLKGKVTATKKANKKLLWKSSNTKYATVSSSGKVKALKAGKGQKVKITAEASDGSGKKKSVTIKIK